jgi:hypothetical protein
LMSDVEESDGRGPSLGFALRGAVPQREQHIGEAREGN